MFVNGETEWQSDSLTAHLNWPVFVERSRKLVRIFNNIQQLYMYIIYMLHLRHACLVSCSGACLV